MAGTMLRARQAAQSAWRAGTRAPGTLRAKSDRPGPGEGAARAAPTVAAPAEARQDTGISTTRPDGAVPAANVVNGVPSACPARALTAEELQVRPVRIFRPAPPTTQSGRAKSFGWRVEWDILQGSGRWSNPLMGWQSSADAMQGTRLDFNSKEDAIAFANKQGYEYFVQEPNERKRVPKAYATQFVYSLAS